MFWEEKKKTLQCGSFKLLFLYFIPILEIISTSKYLLTPYFLNPLDEACVVMIYYYLALYILVAITLA